MSLWRKLSLKTQPFLNISFEEKAFAFIQGQFRNLEPILQYCQKTSYILFLYTGSTRIANAIIKQRKSLKKFMNISICKENASISSTKKRTGGQVSKR